MTGGEVLFHAVHAASQLIALAWALDHDDPESVGMCAAFYWLRAEELLEGVGEQCHFLAVSDLEYLWRAIRRPEEA